LDLHLVVDNYRTHKHDDVTEWLATHPRFHIHYTPTSSSWLNLVERWFRELTQKRLRRGNFTGVNELIAAIKEYLAQNNKQPKPFVWNATAKQIIDKVNRCKGISERHYTSVLMTARVERDATLKIIGLSDLVVVGDLYALGVPDPNFPTEQESQASASITRLTEGLLLLPSTMIFGRSLSVTTTCSTGGAG
jgi:hypothetical protein